MLNIEESVISKGSFQSWATLNEICLPNVTVTVFTKLVWGTQAESASSIPIVKNISRKN